MAECKNCFSGCTVSTFDKCIRYTGDNIDELNICNGDSLDEVLADIISDLLGYATGTGITISLPTPCTYIANKLSADYSLSNILTAYSSAICELKSNVENVEKTIAAKYSFNTSCLTLGSNPSRDDILQATINKTCSNSTAISNISSDYVKASDLNTLIKQYLDSITTGPVTVTQQNTKMVPYVAYEYYGPLSNFDGSGKGLVANGFEKVYLCNGSNGTPDKRGRVAVGVNVGVPGGAMDSAVDPAVANNYQITLKGKLGEFKHANSVNENAPHTHSVTETEHFHYMFAYGGANNVEVNSNSFSRSSAAVGGNSSYDMKATTYTPNLGKTGSAKTNITIGSSGAGSPHNNVQPSIGANYIMYIP